MNIASLIYESGKVKQFFVLLIYTKGIVEMLPRDNKKTNMLAGHR